MGKVFVSYRHVDPDRQLAERLVEALDAAGHEPAWDRHHRVGQRWAEMIERSLAEADAFVVLVSRESIRSDMVREEVRLAHDLAKRPDNPLAILPVRVAYEGALPLDLAASLDPIQYAFWGGDGDTARVIQDVCDAVSQAQALPCRPPLATRDADALQQVTEDRGAPLPRAEPRPETGTMRLGSPFYVVRREDDLVLRLVRTTGSTVVLKGVRQVGKSSLLARAGSAARQAGARTFYLDFQVLETGHLRDLDTLLRFIARRLTIELRTEVAHEQVWSPKDGAKLSLSTFLEQALLAPSPQLLVLLFDEVDRVFGYPKYRDDFFAMLRYWHNQRANRPEPWDRLNLVLAHSTEPALWIQDIHQSPFNVGEHVRLRDFNLTEVTDLNRRYSHPLPESELPRLLELIGGHPFLVRQAFFCLAREQWTFTELARNAGESNGPFGDHLKRYVFNLNRDRALRDAFKAVLASGRCKDEQHFQRLAAAGLIVGADRTSARPRCRLYAEYFSKHL